MSEPALSMPVVHRPWALISIVLVIDLGLAVTGSVLLAKGLSAKSSSSPSPPSAPAPAAAPAPAPAAAPAPAPAPAATPAPAAAPAPAPPPPPPKPDPKAAAKRHVTHKVTRAGAGSAASKLDPQDPYDDLENEIDLTASRSQPELDHCRQSAGDVHGAIRVAFEVLPDGRVTHAAAVENSTGSTQLADCLTATVGRWTFAVHPAQATDFVRPFSY